MDDCVNAAIDSKPVLNVLNHLKVDHERYYGDPI